MAGPIPIPSTFGEFLITEKCQRLFHSSQSQPQFHCHGHRTSDSDLSIFGPLLLVLIDIPDFNPLVVFVIVFHRIRNQITKTL